MGEMAVEEGEEEDFKNALRLGKQMFNNQCSMFNAQVLHSDIFKA